MGTGKRSTLKGAQGEGVLAMSGPSRPAAEPREPDREVATRPVALVTGASSGIGKSFAEQVAADGFDLVLVARDEARLTELADRLREAAGCAVEVLLADLADPAQCARVERRLSSPDRVVELLVNCAGHALRKPFVATSVEDEQRLLDVHVRAVLRLTKAAVDTMCARRRGAVINVGSVAAWAPRGSYSAHKAWVVAFSEAVGAQTADRGVHVDGALPRVRPDRARGASRDARPPARLRRRRPRPARRRRDTRPQARSARQRADHPLLGLRRRAASRAAPLDYPRQAVAIIRATILPVSPKPAPSDVSTTVRTHGYDSGLGPRTSSCAQVGRGRQRRHMAPMQRRLASRRYRVPGESVAGTGTRTCVTASDASE